MGRYRYDAFAVLIALLVGYLTWREGRRGSWPDLLLLLSIATMPLIGRVFGRPAGAQPPDARLQKARRIFIGATFVQIVEVATIVAIDAPLRYAAPVVGVTALIQVVALAVALHSGRSRSTGAQS